jgi:hypothetical protein
MIRKYFMAASAVALAAGSFGLATAGTASASTPTITAGAGSSLNCSNVKATVKVSPALKDNWVHADHQATTGANAEPNSDVRAIPDTTYAPPAPTHVTGKATSSTCHSSSATDGTNTAAITGITVTLADEPAHPTTSPGSCIGLVDGAIGTGPPSTAEYKVTITYKATGAKVTPTTMTDAVIPEGTGNFTVDGGTVTGSFGGSTNLQVSAGVNAATAGIFGQEITGPAPDGTTVANSTVNKGKAPNACQPGVKIKGSPSVPSKPHSATPVAPKGLTEIGIDPSSTTVSGTR